MKALIAIVTCHKFRDRADAQRRTWIPYMNQVPESQRIDIKFFLGRAGVNDPPAREDEVYLDVDDHYEALPFKVRAVMRWAIANGYDMVFKCDDDTYVLPEHLVQNLPRFPYMGRLNNSQHQLAPHGWCSGFAYWLANPALNIIANAPDPDHWAEDLWVGKTLSQHNIKCTAVNGFTVLSLVSPSQYDRFKNQVIAVCEYPGHKMIELHAYFRNGQQPPEPKRPPTDPKAPHMPPTLKNTPQARIFQFGRIIRKT